MKYNIYIYTNFVSIFMENAITIQEKLEKLGHTCIINTTSVPDCINIVLGAQDIRIKNIDIPNGHIIVNLEQLSLTSPHLSQKYINLMKSNETWDYNEISSKFLKEKYDINTKMFKLGYTEKLKIPMELLSPVEDIDILFLGTFNERRIRYFNELKKLNKNLVFRQGVYGDEKLKLISRAKIVLNINFYETGIFEWTRIYQLLINKKFIITEDSNDMDEYKDLNSGLIISAFGNVYDTVSKIDYYLDHPQERYEIAERGHETMKSIETYLPGIENAF